MRVVGVGEQKVGPRLLYAIDCNSASKNDAGGTSLLVTLCLTGDSDFNFLRVRLAVPDSDSSKST